MKIADVLAPAMLVLLAACGGGTSMVVEGTPGTEAYGGPMKLTVEGDEESPVLMRAGAAGQSLKCDSPAHDGGGGDYDGGLASVQGSAVFCVGERLCRGRLRRLTSINRLSG